MTNIFFRKIKALAFDSSFSSSNLVAIIVTYFNFNMNSVVIEAATVVNKIRVAVFHVENLTSLGFRNQYETPVFCRLNEPRPAHLIYFDFCSVMRASSLDNRDPDSEFSFDFVLKLPQNFVTAAATIVSNIVSSFPTPKMATDTEGEL